MTLTCSDPEYRKLMTLVYLGEWMVNAIRKEPDLTFEDVTCKVYAAAQGTPLESLIAFDDKTGNWMPAEKFEEEAHTLIDEYDDRTFWEELTARMTERDLIDRNSERTVRGMRPEERTRAAKPIAKAYTQEFEEHGIDRLGIAED
jgi:hypothetical protein